MKVFASIIIPAYNEKNTILNTLNKINSQFKGKCDFEIIVINDSSNDGTFEILKQNPNLYSTLINNEVNLGKGGSIKKALGEAKGNYIFFQDADDEYDPNDYLQFIDIILKFHPDLIIGSRFHYNKYIRSHYFLNKVGNFIITNLFNIIYNTTFTDIYSCYVVYKKDLINHNELKSVGFEQQAEILGKVVRNGKKFYEVPINYNGRTFEEGKKIKLVDFFKVIFQIIKSRF